VYAHQPQSSLIVYQFLESKAVAVLLTTHLSSTHLSFLVETKILSCTHEAESVGVAHAPPPALDTYNSVALGKHAELDRIHDTPLQAAVDVLLPGAGVEVRLVFVEVERIHAAVQVCVLSQLAQRIDRVTLRHTLEAIALRVTMIMGQTGRYLDTRRAVVPLERVSSGRVHTLGSLPRGQDQDSTGVLLQ